MSRHRARAQYTTARLPRIRYYRHHAAQTDYIPAPRKGWHYEAGKLVYNGNDRAP